MAKAKLTLNRFDSGIIEGPNPRDIGSEASVNLEGLDPSTIGGLRPLGSVVSSTNPSLENTPLYGGMFNNPSLFTLNQGFGYGLFQFSSEYSGLSKHMSERFIGEGAIVDGAMVIDEEYTGFNDSKSGQSGTYIYTLMAITPNSLIDTPENYGQDDFNMEEWIESQDGDGDIQHAIELWCHEYNPDTDEGVWSKLGRDISVGHYPTGNHGFNWNSNATDYDSGSCFNDPDDEDPWLVVCPGLPNGDGAPRNLVRYFNYALGDIPISTAPHLSGFDAGLWDNDAPKNISLVDRQPSAYGQYPQQPYLPKFVNVNGFIRMYDETKEGITYFIGYCRKGLNSNIKNNLSIGYLNVDPESGDATENSSDEEDYPQCLKEDSKQDICFQTDQWHIGPNVLQRPRIRLTNLNHYIGDAFGSDDNSSQDIETDLLRMMWGNAINHMYQPSYATGSNQGHAFNRNTVFDYGQSASHSEGNHDHSGASETGALPMGFNDQVQGNCFFVKTRFSRDENADWPANGGPVNFYYSFIYDDIQESPLTKITIPSGHPTVFNCRLKMSVGVNASDQEHYSTNDEGQIGVNRWATASDMREVQGASLHHYPGPRCTGWKMYYSYASYVEVDQGDDEEPTIFDTETYLMWEMDWDKGYRIAGDSEWQTLNYLCEFQHEFIEPPRMKTFATENGFLPDENMRAVYGTAVFHKQVMWAGNVRKNGIDYPDRILHSPVNMPDVFPDQNFVDIAGRDGDPIKHLEAIGNELLVFKQRKLVILNIETMEDAVMKSTYEGHGVTNYRHVLKCQHGIIYINPTGVFLYDGAKTTNLFEEESVRKISGERWKNESGWISDNLLDGQLDMGYSEENDKLIIALAVNNTTVEGDVIGTNKFGDTLQYNFRTKAWMFGRSSMPNGVQDNFEDSGRVSQMIQDWQNRILVAKQNPYGEIVEAYPDLMSQIQLYNWKEARLDTSTFILKNGLKWSSRDFDFDNLGAKKSIKKIYITYSSDTMPADTANTNIAWSHYTGLVVKYSVDGINEVLYEFGDTTAKVEDKGPIFTKQDTTTGGDPLNPIYHKSYGVHGTGFFNENDIDDDGYGGFRTISLTPDIKSEAKKINSFQLHFSNPSQAVNTRNFNIDDITIIYRVHTTK